MRIGYFLASEEWGPHDLVAQVKTVHRLWPNEALPGELAQVLPTPEHFEATELVTEEMIAQQVPCGRDIDRDVEEIRVGTPVRAHRDA